MRKPCHVYTYMLHLPVLLCIYIIALAQYSIGTAITTKEPEFKVSS